MGAVSEYEYTYVNASDESSCHTVLYLDLQCGRYTLVINWQTKETQFFVVVTAVLLFTFTDIGMGLKLTSSWLGVSCCLYSEERKKKSCKTLLHCPLQSHEVRYTVSQAQIEVLAFSVLAWALFIMQYASTMQIQCPYAYWLFSHEILKTVMPRQTATER